MPNNAGRRDPLPGAGGQKTSPTYPKNFGKTASAPSASWPAKATLTASTPPSSATGEASWTCATVGHRTMEKYLKESPSLYLREEAREHLLKHYARTGDWPALLRARRPRPDLRRTAKRRRQRQPRSRTATAALVAGPPSRRRHLPTALPSCPTEKLATKRRHLEKRFASSPEAAPSHRPGGCSRPFPDTCPTHQ